MDCSRYTNCELMQLTTSKSTHKPSCSGRCLGRIEPTVMDYMNSTDTLEGQPLTTEIVPLHFYIYVYIDISARHRVCSVRLCEHFLCNHPLLYIIVNMYCCFPFSYLFFFSKLLSQPIISALVPFSPEGCEGEREWLI